MNLIEMTSKQKSNIDVNHKKIENALRENSNEKSVRQKKMQINDNNEELNELNADQQMKSSKDWVKSEAKPKTSKPMETKVKVLNEGKNVRKQKCAEERPHSVTPHLSSVKTSSASMETIQTVQSAKDLKALDNYINQKHWNFGIQYILSCISSVLWSIITIYLIITQISDKCWDQRFLIMLTSVTIAGISCIESIGVSLIWSTKLTNLLLKRSKLCFAVITTHVVIGSFNILMAVICFGSNTCYQLQELDKSYEYNVVLKYEVKTLAVIHVLIAITFFICAMLLAVKRNDFKYYVLWRKGILDQYIMSLYED